MTWHRGYVSICAAITGYALAYVACDFARWPRVYYFPVERAWKVTSTVSTPEPMGYVGLVLWGLVAAAVAGGAVYAALGRRTAPIPDRWLRLSGAWALTAVGLGGGYFLWNLWPF